MKTSIFLGIGGSGMKGLAHLLQESGEAIIGFDDNPKLSLVPYADALTALPTADRLVYSDAVNADHPLRIAAENQGVQQMPYHVALGEFSKQYKTIAITGTHGKSSTTAFLAHILTEAKMDPTILVGASLPWLQGNHSKLGGGEYFIVEADEYRKHFLELSPHHAIITSIDFDHPDAFSSIEDVEKAYEEFLSKLSPDGFLAIPETEKDAHPNISWPEEERIITIASTHTEGITVPLPGNHMRMNAALAVAIAEKLGVHRASAITSLQSFPGLSRRFELLGRLGMCDIRSDYGHHPAELAATITGAREVYPDSFIVAVFEPHMPLRLQTFFAEFASALSSADAVIITEPFVPEGRDHEKSDDALLLHKKLTEQGKKSLYVQQGENMAKELIDAILSLTKPVLQQSAAIIFSAGALDSKIRKSVKKG